MNPYFPIETSEIEQTQAKDSLFAFKHTETKEHLASVTVYDDNTTVIEFTEEFLTFSYSEAKYAISILIQHRPELLDHLEFYEHPRYDVIIHGTKLDLAKHVSEIGQDMIVKKLK